MEMFVINHINACIPAVIFLSPRTFCSHTLFECHMIQKVNFVLLVTTHQQLLETFVCKMYALRVQPIQVFQSFKVQLAVMSECKYLAKVEFAFFPKLAFGTTE